MSMLSLYQRLQPYIPEEPGAAHLCAIEDILLTRHFLHRVAVAVGERKQWRQHRMDVRLPYA